ncbi:MAG TPA: prolipoprotein diacylglyceryl transferase [Pyrinomonadaceae bacterium]|jgi:phosphatidylglycerol:prolipoprotein diacylglycerol transferase
MYPEIFRIGSFPVNTYGVLLAIGMLLALFVASKLAARDNLPRERIYDLGLWTLIGGLLGSKVLMYFTEDNVQIFSLDFLRSGGVYYGGFIGGFLALVALIRWYKLPFWKVADAFAPGVAIGQAIGRQGCFAAGCCWGKPTGLPWGVHFTEAAHEFTGVPIYSADGTALHLHPTQMYESIAMLIVFALLVWLHKRKRFDGQVLIAYAIIYGIVRFTIEFLRDDPRGNIFGLTSLLGISTSQIISLLVAACAVIFMIWRLKSVRAPETDAGTQAE